MTKREIRAAIKEIIARGMEYVGPPSTPYVMGGTTPFVALDCRGFVRKAYGQYKKAIGGALGNVREFANSAEERGHLLLKGKRGWPVIYSQITDAPDPGNPKHRRHIAIVLHPIGIRYPKGLAMSAFNPHRDCIVHNLVLPGMKMEFIKPDWALVPVEDDPPITNPEDPIEE